MKIDTIVFMGTPEFAVPTLREIHGAFPDKIKAVFTRPDTPKGRGQKQSPSVVKQAAVDFNLPIYQPASGIDLEAALSLLEPDLIVIVAYGMILPKSVVETYFCINIHPSRLSLYRGASPIQSTLLAGATTTAITLIQVTEKMDSGPILAQQPEEILPTDTAGILSDRLAHRSADLCVTYIRQLENGTAATPLPQDHSQATYCKKITKDDQALSSALSPGEFVNRVRALSPKPAAYLLKDAKRFKILNASLVDGHIQLITIQPEGKNPMPYSDFLLGHPKGLI